MHFHAVRYPCTTSRTNPLMNKSFLLAAAVLFTSGLLAQQPTIPVRDNLTVEGIPALPTIPLARISRSVAPEVERHRRSIGQEKLHQ